MMAQPQGMTLLKAARYTVMPWANGLGTTREIAIRGHPRPSTATGDTAAAGPGFIWRLSMAELSKPGGAFSTLPGVDRVLVLLDGSGVTLAVDGGPAVPLPLYEPMSFPGDVRTVSVVGSEAGRDLGLMVAREHCTVLGATVLDGRHAADPGTAAMPIPDGTTVGFAVAIGGEPAGVDVVGPENGTPDVLEMGLEMAAEDTVQINLDPGPPRGGRGTGADRRCGLLTARSGRLCVFFIGEHQP